MTGRGRRKTAKAPLTRGLTEDLDHRTTDALKFIYSIACRCLDEQFDGNIRLMWRTWPELGTRNQFNYAFSQRRRANGGVPLPRIRRTPSETKIYEVVTGVWENYLDMNDVYPKYIEFLDKCRQRYGPGTHLTNGKVKEVLASLGVSVTRANNVANVDSVAACKKCLERCAAFLHFVETCDGNKPKGSQMYFYDECNINQMKIEDMQCLSPYGAQAFLKAHYSITTQSLCLQLIVDNKNTICHWRLMNTKDDGTVDFSKVIDFLEEFVKKQKWKIGQPKHLFYLDNAASHVRAFKANLLNVSHKKYTISKPYHDKQQRLQEIFELIWAPSCTPKGNLAEFFFRSFKQTLRNSLVNTRQTFTGPQWLKYVQEKLDNWFESDPMENNTFQYICDYMQQVVNAGGKLQLEAIMEAGFSNMEEFVKSLKADIG